MRIDAHQHFWCYNGAEYGWIDDSMATLRRDFLPADSLREMMAAGWDACVAVQARQMVEETRWLLGLADAHPSIAGVVGWVDLQAGEERVRKQLASFGRAAVASGCSGTATTHSKLVGIRHIVQSEPDDRFLLRAKVLEGLAILAEFDLPFDLLIYRRHLLVAAECVARFPGHRFVLDHLAKPNIRDGERDPWTRDIRALARYPNVFAKVSGLVTEAAWNRWTSDQIRPYLDVAFEAFGWDRLMIGSDWPVCLVSGSYERTMDVIVNYMVARPTHEQDAVFGGNAQRFWRLEDDTVDAGGDRVAPGRGRL